jgi:cytochrome c oxidase subunit IV
VTDDVAATDPRPPGEGAEGHGSRTPTDDREVPWRVFGAIGVGIAVLGLVYWSTAYERAGTVMLVLAATVALWIAVFLWLRLRESTRQQGDGGAEVAPGGDGSGGEHDEHYLPHASAWPFAIGLGGATVANGLVLGLWVIVPGVALLALGVAGFARQTRRRD